MNLHSSPKPNKKIMKKNKPKMNLHSSLKPNKKIMKKTVGKDILTWIMAYGDEQCNTTTLNFYLVNLIDAVWNVRCRKA